jgi:hypothetical protein
MTRTSGKRWVVILWLIAAGLALIGTFISFLFDHGVNWTLLAGGFFCIVMALAARDRQAPPAG